MTHYIGLMSGTSLDGVDGALADFSGDTIATLAAAYIAFPPSLRAELMALQAAGDNEIEREAQAANQLESFRIDLRLEDPGVYHDLYSQHAPVSRSHILDCTIVDGDVIVTRVPDKAKTEKAR